LYLLTTLSLVPNLLLRDHLDLKDRISYTAQKELTHVAGIALYKPHVHHLDKQSKR